MIFVTLIFDSPIHELECYLPLNNPHGTIPFWQCEDVSTTISRRIMLCDIFSFSIVHVANHVYSPLVHAILKHGWWKNPFMAVLCHFCHPIFLKWYYTLPPSSHLWPSVKCSKRMYTHIITNFLPNPFLILISHVKSWKKIKELRGFLDMNHFLNPHHIVL